MVMRFWVEHLEADRAGRAAGREVECEPVAASGDHVNGWVQALPRAAAYFASLE